MEVVSLYSRDHNKRTFQGVSEVSSSFPLFNIFDSIFNKEVLRGSSAEVTTFDEMFGTHGILVESGNNFDGLFGPFHEELVVHRCITKGKCVNLHGNMVYKQNHLYDIVPTCYVCGWNSKFNQT